MASEIEDFFGVLQNAKTVYTTPTILDRDDFKRITRDWIEQTYGIQLSKVYAAAGMGGLKNLDAGKLVDKIIEQWPEDLLIEELIYGVNWAKAASVVSNSTGQYGREVPKFQEVWEKVEGEGIRGYIERLATSYGWDENVRLASVDAYKTVMRDEPLLYGYITGWGTEGQEPANNWAMDYLSSIEIKAVETARYGAPQSQGDTSVPPTTAPTTAPTTVPPSSDGAPPSTMPPVPNPVTASSGAGTSSGTVSAANVQAFFDKNPSYDFMNSLSDNSFKPVPYEYFGEFASQYGTFTSPDGETWSASSAMTWLDVLYNTDQKSFTKLQDDLRQAGYFDSGLPKKGLLDETTWGAWASFLGDAARNNRTPKQHFVDTKTAIRQGIWDEQVQMNDVATIQANVRDIGTSLIGRPLRDDEFETLLSSVRQWERDYVAGQTFATQPESVDVNARIEQYITKTMSTEYALANNFNSLRSLKAVFGE
jgi:hypothetical protein